jgi:hypothetical protein
MTTINAVAAILLPGLSSKPSTIATQLTAQTPAATSARAEDSSAASLQMAVTQSADAMQSLYDQQMQAAAAISQDTQSLAEYTTAAFQTIIAKRPDLANVKFDFVSDQGAIKVVSDALSDKDRQWLESQLNANSGLVAAVNSYNTDLGKAQALAAKANAAASPTATLPPSRPIDGSVRFLTLLQGVVDAESQNGWSADEINTDGQGQLINLAAARTTSLAGMIDAKRQLDAIQNDDVISYTKDGRKLYGQHHDNPYAAAGAIGQAFLMDSSASHALASWGIGQGPSVNRLM